MGTGTDVAMHSAGIVLVKGDLAALVRAVHLSRATIRLQLRRAADCGWRAVSVPGMDAQSDAGRNHDEHQFGFRDHKRAPATKRSTIDSARRRAIAARLRLTALLRLRCA